MTSRLDKALAAFTKVYDEDLWYLADQSPPLDLEQRVATIIEDNIQKI